MPISAVDLVFKYPSRVYHSNENKNLSNKLFFPKSAHFNFTRFLSIHAAGIGKCSLQATRTFNKSKFWTFLYLSKIMSQNFII